MPEDPFLRLMYQRHGQHLHFFICDQKASLTITEASPARMPTGSKLVNTGILHRDTKFQHTGPFSTCHSHAFHGARAVIQKIPPADGNRHTGGRKQGSIFSALPEGRWAFFPTVSSAGSGTISTFPARI